MSLLLLICLEEKNAFRMSFSFSFFIFSPQYKPTFQDISMIEISIIHLVS